MGTVLVWLILILVGLIGEVLLWMKSQSKRINAYFCNSVRVYSFAGSQVAKVAAITTAKVAAGPQRNSMLDYLLGMASDLQQMSDNEPELKPLADDFIETAASWRKRYPLRTGP